jgi:hypothetical protein
MPDELVLRATPFRTLEEDSADEPPPEDLIRTRSLMIFASASTMSVA